MALPLTGAISLSQVNSELGLTSTAALDLNATNVRRLAMKSSGAITMADLRGATAIVSNAVNVNLHARAGSPGTAGVYKFVIFPGVTIGGSGATALVVGQFPAGSTIYIDNYGSIQGYGGAANSGTGGDAIYAAYGSQTVIINNMSGASIYAGGGGGGKGGTGGTGGQGRTSYTYACNCIANPTKCMTNPDTGNWECGYTLGCSECGLVSRSYCADCSGKFVISCKSCCNSCTGYNYFAGGAGGAGGNGGVGQGYNQTLAAGAGGAGGGAPGTNGGWGGTGGTGGTGGNWGTSGGVGNAGATGSNGNYTGGSAGTGGSGGGAAGRYLVKGGASVTLNNYGGLAGGLA